ncbi:MAG: hypothetical protein A3J25_01825 [Pseudomonadales bacterium RIFCSPLOWO2_02_FULL_63_210]|uniref:hypothetical protein n=1 Tax=Pseudomonas sp. TaxID=306 RepID=UPI0008C16EB3|nr:MAG: hypothetical protein A3J25_01825 [Pseudomonadales bacterium RIFCSPLOWO2_02_FULL_63_210]
MSTFLNRKTLIGSALALGLLSVAQVPSVFASGDHGEHAHASVPVENPPGKPQAAGSQKMDHDAMVHASMDHGKPSHGAMQHGHSADQAAADNHHDQ